MSHSRVGRAVVAACAMLLLLGSNACATRLSRIHNAYNSVVVVYADVVDEMGVKSEDIPICSGFVVASNGNDLKIITARHCVGNSKPRHIEFIDGDSAVVRSYRYAEASDSAVITARTHHHHPALALSTSIVPGQQLYVIGMPNGDSWSFSSAYSRNGTTDMMDSGMLFYAIECGSCYNGDSGGPVLDDQERVVGIVSRGGGADPGVVFITPAELFKELL